MTAHSKPLDMKLTHTDHDRKPCCPCCPRCLSVHWNPDSSLLHLEDECGRISDDTGRMVGLFHEMYHRRTACDPVWLWNAGARSWQNMTSYCTSKPPPENMAAMTGSILTWRFATSKIFRERLPERRQNSRWGVAEQQQGIIEDCLESEYTSTSIRTNRWKQPGWQKLLIVPACLIHATLNQIATYPSTPDTWYWQAAQEEAMRAEANQPEDEDE